MSNTITGEIVAIQDKQEFASGFVKQEIVVQTGTDDRYPNPVPVEFLKDKINLIQNVRVGDSITISIDIRGREYNDRYFVNLAGWKIENVSSATRHDQHETPPPTDHQEAKQDGYQPQQSTDPNGGADMDGIPFTFIKGPAGFQF